MKCLKTIFIGIISVSSFLYCFAEADYPALHKNSEYRSKEASRIVVLKSTKELEADNLNKYYMSSPSAKVKASKYSLTGEPIYKDPSILRKNREQYSSYTNRNSLIADPTKISKPKKSYYRAYKRKRYNYDFLYEEEPAEETSGTLKLTL